MALKDKSDQIDQEELDVPVDEGEKGGRVGGDDSYIGEGDEEEDFLDELEMEMDEYYS